MIAIVDYGMGNVLSVRHAFEKLGYDVMVTDDKEKLLEATHVILPGVGSFRAAMEEIDKRGLRQFLVDLAKNKPFLGICLGMQLLFTTGEEGEVTEGLNVIPGTVKKIKTDLILPHVGWNQLSISDNATGFKPFDKQFVYFVHTYQALTASKFKVATTTYGEEVTAIVRDGHVFGIQFHPEKSADVGSAIIKQFLEEVKA